MLAKESGISKRMLSDYENGKMDIAISKLQDIARVLKVSVSELIGESEKENVLPDESELPTHGRADEWVLRSTL